MGGRRKKLDFQPVLIVLQIISIQCFYYLGMGTLSGLSNVVFDVPVSMDHFFTDKFVHFNSWSGLVECVNYLLCAIIGAYLLSFIVEKSKKCVDFTFTVYFLHVVFCCMYSQFPVAWEWWIIIIISAIAMASLGEYWCATVEMQDIPAVADQVEREQLVNSRIEGKA